MTRSNLPLKKRLFISAAMAGATFFGYGRQAYAACSGSGGTYLCSGTETTTQYLNTGVPTTVTTAPGFSVNTVTGIALGIDAAGQLNFTDNNGSTLISGDGTGLFLNSAYLAGSSGMTATFNSHIRGYTGVSATKFADGDMSITSSGDITGTNGDGLDANNSGGINQYITLNAGSTVSGSINGVDAENSGYGKLGIIANGAVTGNGNFGIYGNNNGASTTDLTVTTGASSNITGYASGIEARNAGTGATNVEVGGIVSTTSTAGSSVFGIVGSGTNVNITTDAGSSVTGYSAGIVSEVLHGTINITANGDVTATGTSSGIFNAGIEGLGFYSDVAITTGAASHVTAYGDVLVGLSEFGAVAITANGDVTSTATSGGLTHLGAIYAENIHGTTTDITTGAGSSITSNGSGIIAKNEGYGAMTVTANGNITAGAFYNGVYAINAQNVSHSGINYGTDLTITTGAGSNLSGYGGILGVNHGTGALAITADGTVTASGASTSMGGIIARNYGTDLTITTGAASNISGYGAGIFAANEGTGALTITTNGITTATGIGGQVAGIYVKNYASGTDLTVTTGVGSSTTGYHTGILAGNYGTGALTITANGDVISHSTAPGTGTSGITANNSSAGTDLSVTTGVGTNVSGYDYGIKAYNGGNGTTNITVGGSLTANSTGGFALSVANTSAGTDMNITTGASSSVSGYHALIGNNQGTGALTIIADGMVQANGTYGVINSGIDAQNSNAGTDLNITTGASSHISGFDGIFAQNNGTGALTITANGYVNSTTALGAATDSGIGLYAYNSYHGTDLAITTGAGSAVSGQANGILARNLGTGSTSVTANGQISSATGTGIQLFNSNAATGDVSVTTGAGSSITGYNGIYAYNGGTGVLSATINGSITSTGGLDLNLINSAAGTDLTITTGAGSSITGTGGIMATNHGTGMTSAYLAGTINSTTGTAIRLTGYGTGTSITTAAGSQIYGRYDGLYGINRGTGELTITVNGDVDGGIGAGINAYQNSSTGTDLNITTAAGTLVTGESGIYAYNGGTGATTLNFHGDVTSRQFDAIRLNTNYGTNTVLTTDVGSTITGYSDAITINSHNTGYTALNLNGNVISNYGTAVTVNHYGTDLSVTTGTGTLIQGGSYGINLLNDGTGATTMTINGDVTGQGDRGINLTAGPSTTGNVALYQAAGTTISGYGDAIRLRNNGTGSTLVQLYGNLSSTKGYGLMVRNASTAGDLNVITGTGTISADKSGLNVTNQGYYATSITSNNASITSTNGYGITVASDGTTLDITTGTGTISGYNGGIRATNSGYGATTVALNNASITSANGNGVRVRNNGTDLTLTTGTGTITAQQDGVVAYNYGTGATTVTTNGDITSSYGTALNITARNGTTMDVNVAAGTHLSGYRSGINAFNGGSGLTTINVLGDVTALPPVGYPYPPSNREVGIWAGGYGGLNLTTGPGTHVTGYTDGIRVYNYTAGGTVNITVNGDVTAAATAPVNGNAVTGIYVYGPGTQTANITVQGTSNPVTVSGITGISSYANVPLNVTLDGTVNPVTITGTGGNAILFGNADNTLSTEGNIIFHGNVTAGTGTNDTLNLGAGTINMPDAGANTISGFENINVLGTVHLTGNLDATGANLTEGAGGDLHVNGDFMASSLTIGNGAEFGGNNTFTGDLIIGNGGRLSPGNSIGTINVVGNLTFLSGSIFQVEVNGTSSDQVNATGTVTIQPNSTLDIVPLGSFSGSSTPFLTGAGGVTGTFDVVNLNGVATTISYTPTSVGFGGGTLIAVNPSSFNSLVHATQENSLSFADTMLDESTKGIGQGRYVWARGILRDDSRTANGDFSGYSDNIYGAATGAEAPLSDHWKVGFAVGQVNNRTDIHSSTDDSSGDGTYASFYTTYKQPVGGIDFFSTLGATAGFDSIDGQRAVSNSGVAATANYSTDAHSAGLFAQLGARAPIGHGWTVTPKVGIDYTRTSIDGFQEHDGGAAQVSTNDTDFGTWETSEGFTFAPDKGIPVYGEVTMKPHISLSLSQEYAGNDRTIHGSFSNGADLELALDNSSNNFINTGIGADFILAEDITGSLEYDYSYSNNETRNNLMANVSFQF